MKINCITFAITILVLLTIINIANANDLCWWYNCSCNCSWAKGPPQNYKNDGSCCFNKCFCGYKG